jgi:hypothetical protein
MTVSVSVLSPTRVRITQTPSIAARIIYGRRATSQLAILRDGYWAWTAPAGGWVGMQMESEIDDALDAARRTPYSVVS